MCGFVITEDKKNIDLYLSMISHRGLDGYQSTSTVGKFGLAHCALPFVTLDKKLATQPVNGRSVFVGEIFNFSKLTNRSLPTDAHFMDHIFHKEPGLLRNSHLWDGFWSYGTVIKNKLILVSDYLSQKPIYYRTDMKAAASEITPLLAMKHSKPDEVFLSNVRKWGYSPDGRTPWENIKQLEAGCMYVNGKIRKYFNWDHVQTGDLFQMMESAVASRLQGQHEVALLLSGGLDSSIVYGLSKKVIDTITVIHVENEEEEWARLVHEYQGSQDRLESISIDKITDREALAAHQTPVDLGSVKPQLAMAKRIKELGLHCVLTGDGADELFGGYRRANTYDSQQSDVFSELPYYHCPRLDRTMMKHTIELRSPFMRSDIVKYALGLPYSERNGVKKVLMDTFKSIVPREVLHRDKRALKTKEIYDRPLTQRLHNDSIWKTMN